MTKTTDDYNTKKAINLHGLVLEYELENSVSTNKRAEARASVLNALHIDGLIKMHDFLLDQEYVMYEMYRSAMRYYDNAFDKMLKKYKAFNVKPRTSRIQCTTQKAKKYPAFKKQHLRQIIKEFNSQYEN